MTGKRQAVTRTESIFDSYVALSVSLVPSLSGICLLDARLKPWGAHRELTATACTEWLKSLSLRDTSEATPVSTLRAKSIWSAIPFEESEGRSLGFFCVTEPAPAAASVNLALHAQQLKSRLKPLLDCIHRDLAAAVPASSRVQQMTERTAELEWLFKVTSGLKAGVDDQRLLEELLAESTRRLAASLGVLGVPDKHLTVQFSEGMPSAKNLELAWTQSEPHLLAWAKRQNKPLLVNRVGAGRADRVQCKVLCVPVVRESGRVIGVMAFFREPSAADFSTRQLFLARHIGRQAASLVEAQFDLMTGLYTRSGLDQVYSSDASAGATESSVIYLDIDHMHVANELHGFELGNELIVRVADLLAAPLLPTGALAARISGDRFTVVLPASSCGEAVTVASVVQKAAAKLAIGPTREAFDVSISAGVSILLPMPDGLARAIAAAELACKTAKQRGRNRVELYAFEDGSMMRRHSDAMAVGQLRGALKADRLRLFAQRIAPLQDQGMPGGYELLLRLYSADGELLSPGPMIDAAQRYQILPSIDRWVMQRALQLLSAYRGMLRSRAVGMSLNVSGQSMGDETFAEQMVELLREANLPPHCVSVELTEQAAVTNLARAERMMSRLGSLGCRFALDDFGTGANSLSYLKSMPIYRVKIDGSFVRDVLTNRNSQATVHAVVELAKGLGIETVAEYVETREIADLVRKMGVDYAQGYAFGKPEPLEELLEKLARDESQRLHKLFLET